MTVLYEVSDNVAHITLNRPEQRNAFNRQLFADLDAAMYRFKDDREARVCITDAAGPAFSVGYDIKDGARSDSPSDDDGREFSSTYLGDDMDGKPVIVAIHGHCVGQAVANALFGDIRICTPDTIFTLAEARIGISALALPQMLADAIGPSQGGYMLMSGQPLSAEWAIRTGLVHEIVPSVDLTNRANELALSMLKQAPLAAKAHKLIMGMTSTEPRDEVTRAARRFRAQTATSEDFKEGRRAFIERRPPQWKGR